VARAASAGHPPPLVLRTNGSVERVEDPGLIIGVDPGARYSERRIELAAGDALVLYTDGILEARTSEGGFGDARLAAAVGSAHGGGAQDIVAAVTAAVRAYEGPRARDDQAVLVLRAR
jgi:serine phosphatase RsbU (regulator of sigma subunit)